ncbi:Nif3-like dinuclear metal center hexameric protein [Desulfurobacterium indicum]|uniref:GTP cyclohydrolase 1 type 2 homolog n=1 Tax=Desulfurobacterium indicum TaxID=1914305 RepID=A0A1R1MMR5_9BACT|nr:Nif3-like dinuclear metal center hexameric protein [Desulfurobacterium indicum]OMH41111.1 Nif3-like dinuclear metal center hexameric protein [Desulfurobacterium indicum]
MATFREIVNFLRTIVPEGMQDSWDNSGVQIGFDKEVERILFALSINESVVEEAKKKDIDMIVTHHPITISPIKYIDERSVPESFYLRLIQENIPVYSMHTNLDVSPFGPTAIIAEKIGLKDVKPIINQKGMPPYGLVGEIEPVSQKLLVKKLCKVFADDLYRIVNYSPEKIVRKVSVCSGSGASLIREVASVSDFFITGDVKYHDAELAIMLGLTVFDAGHFGTEKLFYGKLLKALKERFSEITFLVAESEKSPFEVPDECNGCS